jgi:hypothetical protein
MKAVRLHSGSRIYRGADVSIETLLKFNKVKALTPKPWLVAAALKQSSVLEVSR